MYLKAVFGKLIINYGIPYSHFIISIKYCCNPVQYFHFAVFYWKVVMLECKMAKSYVQNIKSQMHEQFSPVCSLHKKTLNICTETLQIIKCFSPPCFLQWKTPRQTPLQRSWPCRWSRSSGQDTWYSRQVWGQDNQSQGSVCPCATLQNISLEVIRMIQIN